MSILDTVEKNHGLKKVVMGWGGWGWGLGPVWQRKNPKVGQVTTLLEVWVLDSTPSNSPMENELN